MTDFLKVTMSSRLQTSKITGEVLEDIDYSKLGAKPIASKAGPNLIKIANAAARLTQQGLNDIEADWKEISLDFTQLGLSLVGLIEVAEPAQAAADITNASIDFARGHPFIGAISMISATPLAGLLSGIPLTLIRAFKCVISGLKFIGKTFIAFAVKPACAVGKFIWLRRGVLLNYCNKMKKFIENCTTATIDGLPKITEALMKQIKEFGEKLAREKAKSISSMNTSYSPRVQSAPSALEKSLKTPLHDTAAEARKEVAKYQLFPNTYGNMGKTNLWPNL